ncbi:nucleoside deaminase [Halobacteriales archaeon QH_7_66_37]|nr:MAG: nucleoside deaminase [Halobacteriales archaeon QH_7_66_37]
MLLEGTILRGRSFQPIEGRIVVEDGRIEAIEESDARSDDIILPAFVNAHTHVGDSIAKEAGEGLTLEELVAPPDGLKHRLLAEADRSELVDAMAETLSFMEANGTAAFIEFREGGVEGIEAIEEALRGVDVESVVLGRESIEAMERSDGFGASGANDGEFSRQRNATARRSNAVTDVGLPPVSDMLDATTVALGTDNVMLNSPSMFREMAFTAKLTDVSTADVLRMATINGAEIAGLNCGLIEEGRDARLVVLDGTSPNLSGAKDPCRAVVRRAGVDDIKDVIRS